ncbi:unnamed protein product [Durusdinium trenchii]|uniref:Uncharacterized protein n=1 Tax=Durusdinium trenchii TaxID=1381693 RepID=A0ABP0R1Z7_9DINO
MEASAFITLRSPSGPTLAIEARGVGLDTKRWTAAHSKLGAASCSGTGTAVTALAVCRLRARGVQAARRSRQSRLSCRAQEESAEEQLAALEAELEALEDEMEEDRVRQADLEEAETKSKIEQRFKDAAPGLDSQVVAGRGADAVGVTATVAVCGRSHDSSVAQRVMKLLAAADSPPIFLDSQEVTRSVGIWPQHRASTHRKPSMRRTTPRTCAGSRAEAWRRPSPLPLTLKSCPRSSRPRGQRMWRPSLHRHLCLRSAAPGTSRCPCAWSMRKIPTPLLGRCKGMPSG